MRGFFRTSEGLVRRDYYGVIMTAAAGAAWSCAMIFRTALLMAS